MPMAARAIQVGDKVRTIPQTTSERACNAVVVGVIEHDPEDPVVGHGFVDVRFTTDKRPDSWSQEVESYTHHNWEKFMRLVNG